MGLHTGYINHLWFTIASLIDGLPGPESCGTLSKHLELRKDLLGMLMEVMLFAELNLEGTIVRMNGLWGYGSVAPRSYV
jgi:hypothetical protein